MKRNENLELCKDVRDLAELFDVDFVETTQEWSGYPRNLEDVLISDSIEKLNSIGAELEAAGLEVCYLNLTKKDGQTLWSRGNYTILPFEPGCYMQAGETDFYVDIDAGITEDEATHIVFEHLGGESIEFEDEEQKEAFLKKVETMTSEVWPVESDTRHFLACDDLSYIEYSVSKDQASYYNDSKRYQLAISVTFPESEEE